MFDIGVIRQVLSTQRTIIVNNRFRRSHFVDSSCDLTPHEQKAVFICEHILFLKLNQYICPKGERGVWATESAAAIFYTVFHSNYGSILVSFRDLTTGRIRDWRTMDGRRQPMQSWRLMRAAINIHCVSKISKLSVCWNYSSPKLASFLRSSVDVSFGEPFRNRPGFALRGHEIARPV